MKLLTALLINIIVLFSDTALARCCPGSCCADYLNMAVSTKQIELLAQEGADPALVSKLKEQLDTLDRQTYQERQHLEKLNASKTARRDLARSGLACSLD